MGIVREYAGKRPTLGSRVYLAETAAVIGDVVLGDEIDFLVDGGRTPGGEPSTLIDTTVDPPRVLRAGAFPWPPESET